MSTHNTFPVICIIVTPQCRNKLITAGANSRGMLKRCSSKPPINKPLFLFGKGLSIFEIIILTLADLQATDALQDISV